jgi:hypothetical protein
LKGLISYVSVRPAAGGIMRFSRFAPPAFAGGGAVDSLANYVRLILPVGRYVPDYGRLYRPDELKDARFGRNRKRISMAPLFGCEMAAFDHAQRGGDGYIGLRSQRLACDSQLSALRAVLDIHHGLKEPFDQEVAAVYGVRAPSRDSVY